jgi:hypothetical protein
VQLASSIAPEPPEPQRVPEISRRLGVLCSFLFLLCGLIAEDIKLPHPESMNGGDYVGWLLKAAIIGIEVSLAVNGGGAFCGESCGSGSREEKRRC